MTFGKIGARKMMNMAWINPYVKDGLVAMWDGIWNVGGGLPHDANSPVWWDCIGKKPIISAFPDVFFSENALVLSNSGNPGIMAPVGVFPGSESSYGYVHIECVLTIDKNWTENLPYLFGCNKRALWIYKSANAIGIQKDRASTWQNDSLNFDVNQSLTVSANYGDMSSNAGLSCWLNGQTAYNTGPADSWGQANTSKNKVRLGYTNLYVFLGSYYSIRLYNRTLTDDEVAANYAVDAQRFNLTGGGTKWITAAVIYACECTFLNAFCSQSSSDWRAAA